MQQEQQEQEQQQLQQEQQQGGAVRRGVGLRLAVPDLTDKLRHDPAFLLVTLRLFKAEKELRTCRSALAQAPTQEAASKATLAPPSGRGRSGLKRPHVDCEPQGRQSLHEGLAVAPWAASSLHLRAPLASSCGGSVQSGGVVHGVNERQYERIVRRRKLRILEAGNAKSSCSPAYQHESRHRHATHRPRGPTGRFLTKAELSERAGKRYSGP